MVKIVALNFHWPPRILGGLFIDDWDYKGLGFWVDAVKESREDPKKGKK